MISHRLRRKMIEKRRKTFKEGQVSHSQSIMQLSEQIIKFIQKHKGNPNSVINDFAIGLFLAFSEVYSQDGDPNTNGLNMLAKMIDKLKVLMKEYEDLVPEEEEEFDLEDDDIDKMKTTLDDDDEEELEDEKDSEEKELDEIENEKEDEDES